VSGHRPTSRALWRGRGLFCSRCYCFRPGSAKTQPAQVPDDAIARIIAQADQGAVAEVNRHDAHDLAARFWDDAVDISPAGIVSGRSEIGRRFAEAFKASTRKISRKASIKWCSQATRVGLLGIGARRGSRPTIHVIPSRATPQPFLRSGMVSGKHGWSHSNRAW